MTYKYKMCFDKSPYPTIIGYKLIIRLNAVDNCDHNRHWNVLEDVKVYQIFNFN